MTSTEAAAWADKIYEVEGTDLRQTMPDRYRRGCAFFESGYGWDNDKDKTKVVPLMPVRPLMQNATKVNASHVRVPVFGFDGAPDSSVRCSGDATLQEDANFCVFGVDSSEARVVRAADLTDLSDFCYQSPEQAGNVERSAPIARCQ